MASQRNKMITTGQAAVLLGITQEYVRRLLSQGKLKGEKLGHDWLLTEKAISTFKRQRFPREKDETTQEA